MTTVLKALQDLEQRQLSVKPGALSTATPEESRRWPVLAPALLAVACGALGVAGLLIARQGTPPTATSVATAPQAAVQRELPEAIAPRSRAPVEEEAPWGRVERRVEAAPAAPAAERPAAPSAQPAVVRAPQPAAQAAKPRREAPQRRVREREAEVGEDADDTAAPIVPAPAVEPAPAEAAPAREAPMVQTGAARVEVISIVYSSDVARRTATLRINGGRPVVMHEGQSANGVDVQLILESSVYISNRGNVAEIGVDR